MSQGDTGHRKTNQPGGEVEILEVLEVLEILKVLALKTGGERVAFSDRVAGGHEENKGNNEEGGRP
jgi:hypothetical protein